MNVIAPQFAEYLVEHAKNIARKAGRTYPLLFATISGAHLYGFGKSIFARNHFRALRGDVRLSWKPWLGGDCREEQ